MNDMLRQFGRQVDFLLENACPGIRYRIYRDFLGKSPAAPFMQALQEELLCQPNVQKHLASQHPDGWFGHELHGNDGMDAHIGSLIRAGVGNDHPAIRRAAEALLTPEIACMHKNWFRGGDALDADERGGNRAVTAQILIMAGMPEDTPVIASEIALALEHLAAVPGYSSVDDFSVRGSSRRYYKPKARFPGANHIGILAAAHGWRTAENLRMAASAAAHAYRLMKDVGETITFRKPKEYGGGYVGPFNYNWKALTPLSVGEILEITESDYPFAFAFWLAAVSGIPEWCRQSAGTYDALAELIHTDTFFDSIPEHALRAFRQVSGIEPNYRKKHAARCDVMYAMLEAIRQK